jgi:hypothetical protein
VGVDALAGTTLAALLALHGLRADSMRGVARDVVLRILWDSADGHLKAFRKSPEFAPFFQAIQPFVKSIEEMRHYELTTVRWSR